MTTPAHAVVYSKAGCDYCTRAKELLADKNIPFTELDVMTNLSARRDYLALTDPSPTTVPQVVLNGHLVGGYDQLRSLLG